MWPVWHAHGSDAKFICRSRCRGGGTVSKNLDGIGQIHLWDLQSGLPKGSKPADAQTPPQGSCPYGCWSWRVDSSGSTGYRVVDWPIKVDASLHFEAPRRTSVCVRLDGFLRDWPLQVPWKLLKKARLATHKRVYVCPELTCLHHDPAHALGDLVGIKKHFRRKHCTEKQWVCDKCSKGYAVQSDYKAHLKTCGTRGHCCDCGKVFSRYMSSITREFKPLLVVPPLPPAQLLRW